MSIQDKISVEMTLEISKESIKGAIITALEGGSNYWMRVGDKSSEIVKNNDEFYDLPFKEGGYIQIFELEDETIPTWKEHKLDYPSIVEGLKIMSKQHSKLFAQEFLEDNGDAESSDVFLQCCLLKELVYG